MVLWLESTALEIFLEQLPNVSVAEHPLGTQTVGTVHFQNAILKGKLHGRLVFDILQLDLLQAVSDGSLSHVVLTVHARQGIFFDFVLTIAAAQM